MEREPKRFDSSQKTSQPVKRYFTPEEDAELVKLRLIHHGTRKSGGLSVIARKMKRHRRSIMHRLRLLAEVEEGYRAMRVHRSWSAEETDIARRLRDEGLTYAQVGAKLGRSASSVMQKLKSERKDVT